MSSRVSVVRSSQPSKNISSILFKTLSQPPLGHDSAAVLLLSFRFDSAFCPRKDPRKLHPCTILEDKVLLVVASLESRPFPTVDRAIAAWARYSPSITAICSNTRSSDQITKQWLHQSDLHLHAVSHDQNHHTWTMKDMASKLDGRRSTFMHSFHQRLCDHPADEQAVRI